jgi:CreA protein
MPYCILILTLSLVFLSGCSIAPRTSIANIIGISTGSSDPYEIASVDTAFQFLWPDHQIEVGAVPDPKISGVTCFYSRAKTGGIRGWLGLATDTSDASVSCRQTGPLSFKEAISSKEEIRNESTSFFFKKLRIVRFYDQVSNSLVYLVYSDKLIDGSPKNSLSAVALDQVKVLLK